MSSLIPENLFSPILGTDGYKPSHDSLYPPDMEATESYLEARYIDDEAKEWVQEKSVISYGAYGYLIPKIFGTPVTRGDISEGADFFNEYYGNPGIFVEPKWQKVLDVYGGYIPLHVRVVPEGYRVPISNIMMGVSSTDKELGFLTNYFETRLSHAVYPMSVATLSWNCWQIIMQHLIKSGTPELIDYKLHDFGFRSCFVDEQSAVGASAHLLNFKGSDTLPGIQFLRKFYRAPMSAFRNASIPAAEHSTITSWGRENERAAIEHLLDTYPTGLVAFPVDSYDMVNCLGEIMGVQLRDKIIARQGITVARPDSGDPIENSLKATQILGDKFGTWINPKGFRTLGTPERPIVRVLYGDGINPVMQGKIYDNLEAHGYSSDNVGFGMGRKLLGGIHRDTFGFAFKMCAMKRSGVWRPVNKDPKTDAQKASKGGNLTLYLDERKSSPTYGTFITGDRNLVHPGTDMMRTAYFCGNNNGLIDVVLQSVLDADYEAVKSRLKEDFVTPKQVLPRHESACVLSYDNEADMKDCSCHTTPEAVGYGHGV